jgi:hypothetical protein
MSQTPEQVLEADIEQTRQQLTQLWTSLLPPVPSPQGPSAFALTSIIGPLVEYDGRFAVLEQRARAFDRDQPCPASQHLAAMRHEIQQKIKESSFMASFKMTYEKYETYIIALPVTVPDNASPALIATCIQTLREFDQAFRGFVPRSVQLAAEGILPHMQERWFNTIFQSTQQHIANMQARAIQQQQKAFAQQNAQQQLELQYQRTSDDFSAVVNQFKASTAALDGQLQALNQNPFADRSFLDAAYDRVYQDFLSRLATMEANIQNLADQGKPELLKSFNAWKSDTEGARAKIRDIAADRRAFNSGAIQIQLKSQQDWFEHQQEMHRKALQITDTINRHH